MKKYPEPNDTFGRLKVLKEVNRRHGRRHFLCVCDCENEKVVMMSNLLGGQVRSCGCLKKENYQNITHGQKGTRLYRIWNGMKTRCLNENDASYMQYGGRGIEIYDSWIDFAGFFNWAISSGYANDLTLERINVDGNYHPDNCEWIPLGEQAKNRTNTQYLTFQGETKTMKEWSEETGIEYPTLHARIKKYKWSVERALTTPSLIKRKVQEEF